MYIDILIIIIIIIIIPGRCLYGADVMTHECIERVNPVHAINAEQRQTAADLWTKPPDLSHCPAYRQL